MIKTMVVSSLEKVGLGKEPVPFKEGTSLTVCRGETASFQIAFIDGNAGENTGISVKKVLYEKNGAAGDTGIPEAETPQVRVRQVLSCAGTAVIRNLLMRIICSMMPGWPLICCGTWRRGFP